MDRLTRPRDMAYSRGALVQNRCKRLRCYICGFSYHQKALLVTSDEELYNKLKSEVSVALLREVE